MLGAKFEKNRSRSAISKGKLKKVLNILKININNRINTKLDIQIIKTRAGSDRTPIFRVLSSIRNKLIICLMRCLIKVVLDSIGPGNESPLS